MGKMKTQVKRALLTYLAYLHGLSIKPFGSLNGRTH